MDSAKNSDPILKCGIIMPISEMDGCTDQHWREVKNIFTDAIKISGFQAELVSEADDVGIIQKRIIQNIYENPILVCDVSGKNPNVMFELGLRLAFDKPTIIVKDDKTNYSFDTSPIEHLTYPRDLRYAKIIEFKEKLAIKIKATYDKSCNDPTYTTFLKNFGEFTTPKLDTKEISKDDFIINELKELKKQMILFGRKQINERSNVNIKFDNETNARHEKEDYPGFRNSYEDSENIYYAAVELQIQRFLLDAEENAIDIDVLRKYIIDKLSKDIPPAIINKIIDDQLNINHITNLTA